MVNESESPVGWSVLVEVQAPPGERLPDDDRRLEALADVLITGQHGAIAGDDTGWSARISIDSIDPVHTAAQAATSGSRLVMGAAEMVGLPAWPVIRLQAVGEDVLAREVGLD